MRFYVIFYIFLYTVCSFLTSLSDGTCTFPDSVLGTWVRGSDKKQLVFSASAVSGLAITHNTHYLDTFDCDIVNGTQYVIRAGYTGNGILMYGLLCYDLEEKSANVYFLHILTVISGQELLDKEQANSYTLADVCNKNTVEVTYTTLVKSGATDIAILCPSMMFGTYNYTIDQTLCPGDSELNVCIDRKSIIVNYTMCSETVGYSTMGEMDCIGHIVKGDVTYLSVYIRDTSAADRTTCFAIQSSNNDVLMTSKQVDCDLNQSPTSISAPGKSFQMIPVVTCPFTNDDNTVIIVVAVLVSIVVIAVVVGVIVYLVMRKRAPSKVGDKTTNTANTDTSNANATMTASPEATTNGHAQPVSDEKPVTNEI